MTHARFKILKHVFLENEARLVLLNNVVSFNFVPTIEMNSIYYVILKLNN